MHAGVPATRGIAIALVGVLWLASCSGGDAAPVTSPSASPSTEPAATSAPPTSTTATPATTPTTEPVTVAPPSSTEPSTVPPVSAPPAAPLVEALTCRSPSWIPLPATGPGQVTVVVDGTVFAIDPDGTVVGCLAQLDRTPDTIAWGPQGDRLLVDADLVVTPDGSHASGFEPGTAGVVWSKPKGTALIAPSADGSTLRHLGADDPANETDVAGLATTWAADYHPSGVAIVAAGIARDGTRGLFITDNHGGNVKPLAVIQEDPADVITAVSVSATGNVVTFVHDHTPGELPPDEPKAHVHQIVLPGLSLFDLDTPHDVIPTHLVGSRATDDVAWALPAADGSGSAQLTIHGSVAFSDRTLEPVGFLGDGTGVVVARSPGAASGPGDVWLVPQIGDPVLFAVNVDAAATRTMIGPWIDLPEDIEAQAPG